MKIELSESQLKNLGLFLGRTQLSGGEVSAFVELVGTIEQQERANAESDTKNVKIKEEVKKEDGKSKE